MNELHNNQPSALIVDDNPFNRELLKKFLKTEGFGTEEAKNGKEALEQLKSSDFRLIFMDLLMPGMDGFETIQRIRAMGISVPIIIVSAMSSKEDRQRCLEAGGDDFLPKPIDINKIRGIIKKYNISNQTGTKIPNSVHKEDSQEVSKSLLSDFSKYHILLVEEEDEIAEQYCRFLKHVGFEITRVSNGDQAWDLFEAHKHKFQIIISNVFTSGIDGLGILARIKRDYSNVLVFIYTRDYDNDTFELAIKLGADGTLIEHKFEHEIINLIESALYQSRQKGSRAQAASTAIQVRKAQAQLIRYGCPMPCDSVDIAYSSLSDAGGDIACCKRFNLAGRCGILLGDVAGHSVMSSYVSAFSLGILTSNWDKNQNPKDLLKTINFELNKSDYEQSHLCATALLWDRKRGKAKITSAGNPGGLIARKSSDRSFDFHEPLGGGICLGLLKDVDSLFVSHEILFENGDYFFLFSDGIKEEDIVDILSSGSVSLNRKSIQGLSQEILDRILEKQGQDDDMILITLRQPPMYQSNILHYEFLSSYEAADKACKWVIEQGIADKIPKRKDARMLISLALREALINAVRHGNKFNSEAFVDISVYASPKELRIDISDEGAGFELPKEIKRIEEINIFQSGGRGLSVMYSIADALEVNGGTVSLKFEI